MLQLNTSPAVLEVLGAPVAGSDVRASVMTGAPHSSALRLCTLWQVQCNNARQCHDRCSALLGPHTM